MEFDELKEIGLTQGEIKVYIALLNLGLSTKGPISRKARVAESKVYEILDRLKEKGLVSFIFKKKGIRKIAHYKASNPILLKDFLSKKKEEIKKEEELLEKILPSLQIQQKQTEQEYNVVIYEGFKGIQANNKELLDMINKDDEWIAMGARSNKDKKYNLFWINWLKERAKKGGKGRILFVDKGTWYFNQLKKIKNTEVRYLKGISPISVNITANRVMIYNYKDHPSCLVITNKDISDSFKEFFKSLWNIAQK